jgi:biopolymer transport protein TolR
MQLGSADEASVKADINVTPLVDVCLVLLIIFMVITPMLQKGVPVVLPETKNPDKKPDNPDQMIISIKEDSTIYMEQDWVPKNEFVDKLKEVHDRNPAKEILIKADARLRYKDVKKLMDMINEAGFENIGLITEKIKEPGKG